MAPATETIARLVGAHVSELRRTAGITQEALASRMNELGANWRRATVTQVETGRRSLTFPEAIALASIFDVALTYLVFSAEPHRILVGDASWDSQYLFAAAAGMKGAAERHDSVMSPLKDTASEEGRAAISEGLARLATWRAKWPADDSRFRPGNPVEVAVARRLEAISRLGVTPFDVAAAAWQRWGRTIEEERDRRARRRLKKGANARSRQAVRGLVMREIDRELLEEIEGAADRAEGAAPESKERDR